MLHPASKSTQRAVDAGQTCMKHEREREREREDYLRTVLLQSKKRFKRGGLDHRICQRETNGMNKNEIVRIKTPWYAHKVLCWHDMMNDNAWNPSIERNVSKRGCKSWTYPDFPHHVQTKEKERCRLPRGRQANSNIVGGRRRRTKRKEMAGKRGRNGRRTRRPRRSLSDLEKVIKKVVR